MTDLNFCHKVQVGASALIGSLDAQIQQEISVVRYEIDQVNSSSKNVKDCAYRNMADWSTPNLNAKS